jgi:hypothetical protein
MIEETIEVDVLALKEGSGEWLWCIPIIQSAAKPSPITIEMLICICIESEWEMRTG